VCSVCAPGAKVRFRPAGGLTGWTAREQGAAGACKVSGGSSASSRRAGWSSPTRPPASSAAGRTRRTPIPLDVDDPTSSPQRRRPGPLGAGGTPGLPRAAPAPATQPAPDLPPRRTPAPRQPRRPTRATGPHKAGSLLDYRRLPCTVAGGTPPTRAGVSAARPAHRWSAPRAPALVPAVRLAVCAVGRRSPHGRAGDCTPARHRHPADHERVRHVREVDRGMPFQVIGERPPERVQRGGPVASRTSGFKPGQEPLSRIARRAVDQAA